MAGRWAAQVDALTHIMLEDFERTVGPIQSLRVLARDSVPTAGSCAI